MDRKARENLEAAETLLGGDPATNASATRAYYAAYHGTWAAMVDAGHSVPETEGRRYFPHVGLPRAAREAGILDVEQAEVLAYLRGVRVKADYREDDVGLGIAAGCVDDARRLLHHLLGRGEELT